MFRISLIRNVINREMTVILDIALRVIGPRAIPDLSLPMVRTSLLGRGVEF